MENVTNIMNQGPFRCLLPLVFEFLMILISIYTWRSSSTSGKIHYLLFGLKSIAKTEVALQIDVSQDTISTVIWRSYFFLYKA